MTMTYEPTPHDLLVELLVAEQDELTIEQRIAALCRRIIDEMFPDAPQH